MKKLFLIVCALALAGCNALASLPGAGTPPQLPAQVQVISRTALNFAFSSFDAGLYAFDFAMDLKKPAPGTTQAKAIAAAGRKVLTFLNAAESARRAGNAASYEQAFADAQAALTQFRSLLGIGATHALGVAPPSPVDRGAVLARAG